MKQYNTIYNHYIQKIQTKGLQDYQILDWESKNAQYNRFAVFSDSFFNFLDGKMIIDIGCGLGDFAKHLDSINKNIIYDGYDILEEMISLANKKIFSNIKAKFYHNNILKNNALNKKYHYLYSSGIFNLNVGNNLDFFDMAMDKFFDIATEGICFNLLDKKSEHVFGAKYFYYDKNVVFDSIKSKYSRRIRDIYLVDSYLENDFSIVCFLN